MLDAADKAGDIQAATDIATMMQQSQEIAQPAQPQAEPGFFDMVTGESRMTPQMESLQEIGAAPELNAMSVPAFKASLGLLSTGETEPLKAILAQQFGEDISFTDDEKGNVIVNFPSGQYALNTPGLSGQDVIRGAFDFAAFTPAGRAASIPTALAKNAAVETAIEGTEASLGGEFNAEDVLIAGGIGAGGKVLENTIGSVYRAAKGSSASPTIQAAKDAQIPVMTSDIRPPDTFAEKMAQQTGEKIPFFGTGAQREVQQTAREQAVDEVRNKYGEFSYAAVVDSLKTQKNKVKNAAGSVLQSVGKKLDDTGEISTENTKDAITKAMEQLTKPGVMKSAGALHETPDEILANLVKTMDEAPQTFTTLKENRTAFREIVQGADKAERSQMTSRGKALLKSVEDAMGKDMESLAKTSLSPSEFSKWKKANAVYANEVKKLTKTRLKNVLDKGDVTPESVQTMLFSQKPSEVKNLYKSLTPEGRANARSAIISKVFNDLSRRSAGVTPNTFASEMNKYGIQVNEFFKGEEKKQLSGLIKALNATRRAQDASVTTPTGQQVLGAGAGLALFTDPLSTVAAAMSLGSIARLYESPAVRNALLRLDSIPARSTQFEKALLEFQTILNATAQTMRDESADRE